MLLLLPSAVAVLLIAAPVGEDVDVAATAEVAAVVAVVAESFDGVAALSSFSVASCFIFLAGGGSSAAATAAAAAAADADPPSFLNCSCSC